MFKHIFKDKHSDEIIVSFHGTGGDELDLIPLIETVTPNTSILSLRGNIVENGMNRFFKRFDNGSFDVENIKEQVNHYNTFIEDFKKNNDFSNKVMIGLGYSNGANFLLSMLFTYPQHFSTLFCLHPMVPYIPNQKIQLINQKIFITYGEHDNYATKEQIEMLRQILYSHQAKTEYFKHPGGHEITREEVQKLKDWYTANIKNNKL